MAGRVTQLPIEISGSGQVPNARITQLITELSGSGQIPSARITQLIIEISAPTVYNLVGIFADTLSFSDAVAVDLVVSEEPSAPLTQVIADDLNTWADSINLGLIGNLFQEVASQLDLDDSILEYVIGHLGEEVSDTLDLSDALEVLLPVQLEASVASTLNSWLDSFSVFSPQLVFKQVSDYFTLSDSILLAIADELTVEVGDTLYLSDILVVTLDHQIQVGDSLNNWQDVLEQIEFLSRLVADTLNNWGDAVSLVRNWALSFGDRMVLDDKIQVSFLLLALLNDTLVLSDSQQIRFNTFQPIADTLTLDDSISLSLSTWVPNAVADTMSMADYIEVRLSTYEDDYYRRYLDDRNLMIGELKTFHCDRMTLRDEVAVWMN